MKVTSRKAPNGNAIPFLVSGDDIWLSQRATAALFSTTTQNINQHVYDISKRIDLGHLKQEFTTVQTEGKRDITRSIIHFSFEIVHMVALRAHAWEELDWLVQLSKDLGLLKQHYRVVPKKQRDFGELVQGVMQGITPVIPQFRVGRRFIDFYLPDYCIAVEYDEDHHKSRRRSLADKHREREIRSHIPNVVFLRVMEGEEVPALNRLLLLLIGNLQPKSHR